MLRLFSALVRNANNNEDEPATIKFLRIEYQREYKHMLDSGVEITPELAEAYLKSNNYHIGGKR